MDGTSSTDVEREGESAHERCLHFLSFRPRSRREVADYLHRRGVRPEVSALVLERLERSGLIDDREFASYWVGNRQRFSPRGDRAIGHELRNKGVEQTLAHEALRSLPEEGERAFSAGRTKLRAMSGLDRDAFHRRMFGFLTRRGFGFTVSHGVTETLWRELHGEG